MATRKAAHDKICSLHFRSDPGPLTFVNDNAWKLQRMVPRGLEPRTLRLLALRSNQLSYETADHRHMYYCHTGPCPTRLTDTRLMSNPISPACSQHWVHSSVVRAAVSRSAGPWLKSRCAPMFLTYLIHVAKVPLGKEEFQAMEFSPCPAVV